MHRSVHAPAQTLGQRLQAGREARGLDLTGVAAATRIPLRHLSSIEADAHESLPALPYTLGFIRAFARTVGLPAEEMVAQFRRETNKQPPIPQMPDPPISPARVPPRALAAISALIVLLVVAAVIAFGTGWFGSGKGMETPSVVRSEDAQTFGEAAAGEEAVATEVQDPGVVATIPAGEPAGALPTAEGVGTPAPAATAGAPGVGPAAMATGAAGEVVIRAKDDAWLKVYDRNTGETVKMGILPAGESYTLPADRPGLLLWTGRAGALELSVGGKPVPALGGPADTVRDVSLAPADLAARVPG